MLQPNDLIPIQICLKPFGVTLGYANKTLLALYIKQSNVRAVESNFTSDVIYGIF